jgi:hypothetical protein
MATTTGDVTAYTSVTCETSCNGYPLCDVAFACPYRTTCGPSTSLPPGYSVCR